MWLNAKNVTDVRESQAILAKAADSCGHENHPLGGFFIYERPTRNSALDRGRNIC